MKEIRVLIADDHVITREGVALILNRLPEFTVIGQAKTGKQAVELAETLQPDIAMLDVNMPELDGIEACRIIRESQPAIKILILTMFEEDDVFFDAVQAGASGYVLKGAQPENLIDALKAIHQGDIYFSPPMTRKLVNAYLASENNEDLNRQSLLTSREKEVMHLLAQGLTNRRIAERLVISPNTVQTHRTHIMEKLGLKNRTELIHYAVRHKLLEL